MSLSYYEFNLRYPSDPFWPFRPLLDPSDPFMTLGDASGWFWGVLKFLTPDPFWPFWPLLDPSDPFLTLGDALGWFWGVLKFLTPLTLFDPSDPFLTLQTHFWPSVMLQAGFGVFWNFWPLDSILVVIVIIVVVVVVVAFLPSSWLSSSEEEAEAEAEPEPERRLELGAPLQLKMWQLWNMKLWLFFN